MNRNRDTIRDRTFGQQIVFWGGKEGYVFSFQTKQAAIYSKNALLSHRPGGKKTMFFLSRPNRQQFAVKMPCCHRGQNLLINTFVKIPTCVVNSSMFESILRTRGSLLVINWPHCKSEVSLWPSYLYQVSTLYGPLVFIMGIPCIHRYMNLC